MTDNDKIFLTQINFKAIRKALGWSITSAAEKLGVSRQTIFNIDAGRSKMTKTQYLAICYLIDEDVKDNPGKAESLYDMLFALGFTDGSEIINF